MRASTRLFRVDGLVALSRATRSFPKLARGTVMSASGSDPNSVSGARRARVAVVGGGIAGLTAASHLARAGCDVVVYETGRGPGGRTSTRRGGPERPEWQWDHGAQYFSCKEPDGPFRPILEEWIAAGCVAEWTGVFGVLDATSGVFTLESSDAAGSKDGRGSSLAPMKKRFVGTPGMNAVCKSLASAKNVHVLTSRRVVGFEGGPTDTSPTAKWTVLHRSSDSSRAGDALTRDVGYAAIVAADKQLASDRSRRVYGEPPPAEGLRADTVRDGMRAAGQTPSFALMLAVRADEGDAPLFNFDGAVVEGDDVIGWIACDGGKPGRPGGGDFNVSSGYKDRPRTRCWVVQSTAAYAAERIKAKMTVPGTSPHAALLEEVAEEMTAATVAAARRARNVPAQTRSESPIIPEVVYAAAHRWGAAFPIDSAVVAEIAESSGSRPGCLEEPERRVVGCGDFCVSPKVDGAAISGAAAAAATLAFLGIGLGASL